MTKQLLDEAHTQTLDTASLERLRTIDTHIIDELHKRGPVTRNLTGAGPQHRHCEPPRGYNDGFSRPGQPRAMGLGLAGP